MSIDYRGNRAGDSPNKGLWEEYVVDGKSSYTVHDLKVVKHWCAKGQHDFQIVDVGKRLARCKKCGQESHFIVGVHEVDGDKVQIY